jgi:Protein of unknown function (DUF3592)
VGTAHPTKAQDSYFVIYSDKMMVFKPYKNLYLIASIIAFMLCIYLFIPSDQNSRNLSWKTVKGVILKTEEKHTGMRSSCTKRVSYKYEFGNKIYYGDKIDSFLTDFEGYTPCDRVNSLFEGALIELKVNPKNPSVAYLANSGKDSILEKQILAFTVGAVLLFSYLSLNRTAHKSR